MYTKRFNLLQFSSNPEPTPPSPADAPPVVDYSKMSTDDLRKQPWLQDLLGKTRQEEKEKLYSDITGLKTSVQALTDDLESRKQRQQEIEQKAEKDRIAALSAEERMQETQRLFEQRQQEAQQAHFEKLNNAQREVMQMRLEMKKSKLMQQHSLPEKYEQFVRGDSEEDLIKSIELIQAIRKNEGPQPRAAEVTGTVLPAGTEFPPTNAGIIDPAKQGLDLSKEENLLRLAQSDKYFEDENARAEALRAANASFRQLNP